MAAPSAAVHDARMERSNASGRWVAAAVVMLLAAVVTGSVGIVRALQPGGDGLWLGAATVIAWSSAGAALRAAVPGVVRAGD